MNLFEKFSLAKQVSFPEGRIEIFKQPLVMLPGRFLGFYTYAIINQPEELVKLYYAAKESVKTGIATAIGRSYGFSFKDFVKWFIDSANLSGWGKVKFENLDQENRRGEITIENSIVGEMLKGTIKRPCDHMIRGIMAGGGSTAFREDIDFVETECIALGAQKCRFAMGSKKDLAEKLPEIAKEQLGGF